MLVNGFKENNIKEEIITFHDAEAAVEKLSSLIKNVKLIMTDGILSGQMKGWDLAEKIKSIGYNGPIIYTGASSIPIDKQSLFSETFPKEMRTSRDAREDLSEIIKKYLH